MWRLVGIMSLFVRRTNCSIARDTATLINCGSSVRSRPSRPRQVSSRTVVSTTTLFCLPRNLWTVSIWTWSSTSSAAALSAWSRCGVVMPVSSSAAPLQFSGTASVRMTSPSRWFARPCPRYQRTWLPSTVGRTTIERSSPLLVNGTSSPS